nr:glycosaminoglycan xylosylkinase homolog [Onthophagus taurus]
MYVITNPQTVRIKIYSEIIEEKIQEKFNNLPDKYKRKSSKVDLITQNFIKYVQNEHKSTANNVNELWKEANMWINKTQLYSITHKLGYVIDALKNSDILQVGLNPKGTQLKFLLTLEGNQKVVFKPKRYDREEIINGVVYAGKDRYGSEILSFYLSGLLNRPLVPLSAERKLSIKKEVIPLATENFLKTLFIHNNNTCVYGECYYCNIKDPVCAEDGYIYGAVIFYINYKFKLYPNPWKRTYKKNLLASWETNEHFCKVVTETLNKNRILDLIDVSILDFLIQNGDRHHYELLNDTLIWLDNGKGLGNPFVDHIDILAPLYQCCMIRNKTLIRLQELSGGVLTESIKKMPDVDSFVSYKHLEAIERRLLLVYATIELCNSDKRLVIIK